MKMNGSTSEVSILVREIPLRKEITMALGIAAFAFLTAIGAYIRIPLPFTPVPVTAQVFFVLLCGLMLGPVCGTASQLAYLGLGVAGLPMFTLAGAGFGHLAGPTGGYIIGFIAAQAVIGYIARNKEISILRLTAAMAAGISIIYFFGAMHLKVFLGTGLEQAFVLGVLPFIPGEIIKGTAAAALVYRLRKN